MPVLSTLLSVLIPCWAVNVSLNALYVLKKHVLLFQRIDAPLDGRGVFSDGMRFLGDSTTWLGLLVAAAATIVIILLTSFSPLESLLISFGVYGGHALGSFIKRRSGYADGEFMFLVDHGDSVACATVLLASAGSIPWLHVVLATASTIVVQPLWNYIWFRAGCRKYPL